MNRLYFNAVESDVTTSFARCAVRFMVVGGHATRFYGHLRSTKDLDLFVLPSIENAELVCGVLAAKRFTVTDELKNGLAQADKRLILPLPLPGIDLITSLTGVDFVEAEREVAYANVEGVRIPIISKRLHVTNKLARGEPKDLEDVRALQ
jgi:hypothetical protein